MTKYQLAKLVQWAGRLKTRKRLQKVAYLLQVAGCPLDAAFRLHFYGPFAPALAELCDDMVRQGLLIESAATNTAGAQYDYELSALSLRSLEDLETAGSPTGMEPFEDLARRLLAADLETLELAATIGFYFEQCGDWPQAVSQTTQFKKVAADGPAMIEALTLAQAVRP